MEQNRPAPRRALSPKERRRRHRIRLVRNWTVFLLSCGAVMAVMTGGILWLLPRAYALIAPPTAFEAREYEGGAETDLSDKRLVLVNANLPLTEEPTPELAVADDATGVSLEAEAAAAYRDPAADLDDDLPPVRSLSHIPGLDEARTAAMLTDPNIVTVYDFEVQGQTAYLIMEYIEGITLTELLHDYADYLTLDMVAAVFGSVAHALEVAHENQVLVCNECHDLTLPEGWEAPNVQ